MVNVTISCWGVWDSNKQTSLMGSKYHFENLCVYPSTQMCVDIVYMYVYIYIIIFTIIYV